MKVFAISDFHLSFAAPFNTGDLCHASIYKPMDIFGGAWHEHCQKIYDNWLETVNTDDIVLMPGDTSWGMTVEQSRYDFDFLSQLPGTIYLSRGNHDYWWQGIKNVRKALPKNVIPLNHDSAEVAGKAVCATRGWILPTHNDWSKEDEKIYQREILRLEMALKDGKKRGVPLFVMLHYQPFYNAANISGFVALMIEYGVEACIYGHLHGEDCKRALEGSYFGIDFYNVSCDCRDFKPLLLWQRD